ncbi:esterase-like activity of phytase family protein, partial [bacterium M00.F.Ca.ET.162.01.1.1]
MNQFKRMMMVSLSISAFFISASTHTYAYNDDVKNEKTASQLKYIDTKTIPYNKSFKNT